MDKIQMAIHKTYTELLAELYDEIITKEKAKLKKLLTLADKKENDKNMAGIDNIYQKITETEIQIENFEYTKEKILLGNMA